MSQYKAYPKYKPSGVDWIGDIPEEWSKRKLKFVTSFVYGNPLSAEDRIDADIPVYGSNGKVGMHNESITKNPCIVIGRKGSYGKINYSKEKCFPIDTTYFIDERFTKENLRWLYYLLSLLELDKFSQDTGVPGLSREYAYSKDVCFCTPDEQQQIANFLDKKTARIDELIDKKQKMIKLLKEKRAAIINQAVTCGLDKNGNLRQKPKSLPTKGWKPSGIDWIGDIPEGWEIMSLRRCVLQVKTGATPPGADEVYYSDKGFNWYTPADFSDGLTLSDSGRKLSEIGKIQMPIFPANTIMLVGIGATIGKFSISRDSASCNQQINAIILKNDVDVNFLAYYLRTQRDYIVKCGKFTTLPIINQTDTKDLLIVFPPIKEQKQISEYLDAVNDKISESIDIISNVIKKLQEYRTALITAAVTGKIDVREEALWMIK